METRLTLRPGKDGTKKLLQRFGKRLVAVRYLYDAAAGRRYKTVELIVESQTWSPRLRRLRRTPDDIVAVRIHFHEAELRARQGAGRRLASGAENLGAHLGRRAQTRHRRPGRRHARIEGG